MTAKPKPIELATYGVITAGYGIVGLVVFGLIAQFAYGSNQQKLDRFNANYWFPGAPIITIVAGLAAVGAHGTISALRRAYLQSDAPEPVRPQAPQAFSEIAESALFPQSNEVSEPAADVRSQFETLYAAPEHPSFVPEQAPKSNHPLDL